MINKETKLNKERKEYENNEASNARKQGNKYIREEGKSTLTTELREQCISDLYYVLLKELFLLAERKRNI